MAKVTKLASHRAKVQPWALGSSLGEFSVGPTAQGVMTEVKRHREHQFCNKQHADVYPAGSLRWAKQMKVAPLAYTCACTPACVRHGFFILGFFFSL